MLLLCCHRLFISASNCALLPSSSDSVAFNNIQQRTTLIYRTNRHSLFHLIQKRFCFTFDVSNFIATRIEGHRRIVIQPTHSLLHTRLVRCTVETAERCLFRASWYSTTEVQSRFIMLRAATFLLKSNRIFRLILQLLVLPFICVNSMLDDSELKEFFNGKVLRAAVFHVFIHNIVHKYIPLLAFDAY